MERQLRLAERRGLLSARNLSPIAEAGLELLYHLDNREKQTREVGEIKVALIANDPSRLNTLYPQWFTESPEDAADTAIVYDGTPEAEAVRATGSYVEDYSEVEWVTPEDQDFEEMLRLAEALAGAQDVTLHQDEGGEWY
jgi:hypothetical protein